MILINNTRIRLKFKGSCLKQEDTAPFTPNSVVNLFIVYEIVMKLKYWFYSIIFRAIKLTKNIDPDKYEYSGYGRGFESRPEFLFTDESYWNNVIIFGADMSSSVHVDNKENNILTLGDGPTQGLDDTTLTAEAKYQIGNLYYV